MATKLTTAQQNACKALGIDWTKLDWAKIGTSIVSFIEALLGIVTPTPAPAMFAVGGDVHAALKAAGCPDDCVECCCKCLESAHHSMKAAELSLCCCAEMNKA